MNEGELKASITSPKPIWNGQLKFIGWYMGELIYWYLSSWWTRRYRT